jgi:hypothetical protein
MVGSVARAEGDLAERRRVEVWVCRSRAGQGIGCELVVKRSGRIGRVW